MRDIRNIKENEVIHCSTKEESGNIRQLLHDNEYKWATGDTYIEHNYGDNYRLEDYVCYRPKEKQIARHSYYKEIGYTIIPAKEYLPTIDDLREGRIAIINDGTRDELNKVIKSVYKPTPNHFGASYKYYNITENGNNFDMYNDKPDLPLISVKYFIELINNTEEEKDLIKLFKEGKIAIEINYKDDYNANQNKLKEIDKFITINYGRNHTYDSNKYTYYDDTMIGSLWADNSTNLPTYITDQFIEYINKQQNKQTMKTRILTRSNFKRIHDVACTDWKSYLEVEFKDLLFKDEVVVSEPFYNKMRKAATASQNTLLDEIFGKDDNSVNISDMGVGQVMKITRACNSINNKWIGKYILKTYSIYVMLSDASATWDFETPKDLFCGIIVPAGTKLEIITK